MIIYIRPEDFGLTTEEYENLTQEEQNELIKKKFGSNAYPISTAGATCIVKASGIIN